MWAVTTSDIDDTREGDLGYPENNEWLIATASYHPDDEGNMMLRVDWSTATPGDINVFGIIEDPSTKTDILVAIDYFGYVREYNFGENDGYENSGDRYGEVNGVGIDGRRRVKLRVSRCLRAAAWR